MKRKITQNGLFLFHADEQPRKEVSAINSFMSWIGGKKALRDEILLRFPLSFERYIEVFGGGGWVLFHKPPGREMEVYPSFDETKVRSLLSVLNSLADFVVVDCTSALKNPISRVAIKEADTVIRLASPDLKSISFFSSQLPLYGDPVFRLEEHIEGINVPDADLYMPIEEAKSRLHDPRFVVPYSRAVKQQMLDGKLTEPLNDKKYNDRIKSIVEKIVG